MGVYIKGMKMPGKCGSCDLFHAESPMHCTVVKGHRTVGAPYGMPRPDWCPLVEVKEPHGRLIDADEIVKDLRHDVTVDQDMLDYEELTDIIRETTQADKDIKQNASEIIESTPTVIERSE